MSWLSSIKAGIRDTKASVSKTYKTYTTPKVIEPQAQKDRKRRATEAQREIARQKKLTEKKKNAEAVKRASDIKRKAEAARKRRAREAKKPVTVVKKKIIKPVVKKVKEVRKEVKEEIKKVVPAALPPKIQERIGDPFALTGKDRDITLPFFGKTAKDVEKQKAVSKAYVEGGLGGIRKHPEVAAVSLAIPAVVRKSVKVLGAGAKVVGLTDVLTKTNKRRKATELGIKSVMAGIGTGYAVSIKKRVTAPINDVEPTSEQKAARLGDITATELIPLAAGQKAITKLEGLKLPKTSKVKPKITKVEAFERAFKPVKTLKVEKGKLVEGKTTIHDIIKPKPKLAKEADAFVKAFKPIKKVTLKKDVPKPKPKPKVEPLPKLRVEYPKKKTLHDKFAGDKKLNEKFKLRERELEKQYKEFGGTVSKEGLISIHKLKPPKVKAKVKEVTLIKTLPKVKAKVRVKTTPIVAIIPTLRQSTKQKQKELTKQVVVAIPKVVTKVKAKTITRVKAIPMVAQKPVTAQKAASKVASVVKQVTGKKVAHKTVQKKSFIHRVPVLPIVVKIKKKNGVKKKKKKGKKELVKWDVTNPIPTLQDLLG